MFWCFPIVSSPCFPETSIYKKFKNIESSIWHFFTKLRGCLVVYEWISAEWLVVWTIQLVYKSEPFRRVLVFIQTLMAPFRHYQTVWMVDRFRRRVWMVHSDTTKQPLNLFTEKYTIRFFTFWKINKIRRLWFIISPSWYIKYTTVL